MTEQQKERITLLRECGYSYNDISDHLEISTNTVRSFCNRKKIQVKEHKEIHFCKNCGLPITGEKKLYCNRKCKTEYWNHHPKIRKGQVEKTCPTCGKSFFSYPHENRKYCSHSCYIKERFGCFCSDSE